jgi:pimeloyl-ACP methyl ester carboxylesterase
VSPVPTTGDATPSCAAADVVVPARVPGELRRGRLDTGQVELGTVEVGPAAAPAVVVAHGVGSSARFVVEAFAAAVIAAGARLVTYDLRGHGSSSVVRDPAAHRLDDHVADLAAVVASLPRAPAVLAGVSLGGHAVVRAADRGVQTAAVVACLPAWTGPSMVGEGPHAVVAAEVRRVGIGTVIARLRADSSMPTWLRDTLVTDYGRHDPDSLTAALVALDGGDAPSEEELRHLGELPFAAIGWPEDPGHPLAVARRWAALAPRGRCGQLTITDLSESRSRLGEIALTTLAAVAPDLLPGWSSPPLGEDRFGDA